MVNIEQRKDRMLEPGMSQTDLGVKLGVPPQNVSAWFSRGSISKKYLIRVINLLGIDIKNSVQTKTSREYDDRLVIPTITTEAGASVSMELDALDEMCDGEDVVIRRDGLEFTNKSNLMAIPVSGISMLPTIMPNEYVVIDKGITNYVGDDLYVLNYAGNLLVKRLQYDPSANSFDVISDNPTYKNYKINLAEDQSYFKIIGRVVTTIRR